MMRSKTTKTTATTTTKTVTAATATTTWNTSQPHKKRFVAIAFEMENSFQALKTLNRWFIRLMVRLVHFVFPLAHNIPGWLWQLN